ncbi:MAG: addiction module protein [Ginsengibacter sp.]
MDVLKQMRSEVKKYIDSADAKVVKMVYAMLEAERESDWWQDENILSIVEERSAEYKSGKAKGIPWETAKKQILSSKRKG